MRYIGVDTPETVHPSKPVEAFGHEASEANRTLVEVLPNHRMPDIDVLAVYPSRRHLSAKVRVMVDFLAAAFAGTPPWDRPI